MPWRQARLTSRTFLHQDRSLHSTWSARSSPDCSTWDLPWISEELSPSFTQVGSCEFGAALHLRPALVIDASNLADPTIPSRPQNEGFALCSRGSHRRPEALCQAYVTAAPTQARVGLTSFRQ